MADNPHFDLPFQLGSGGAAVTEQDSLDDIANCVVAILSTYVGSRDEVPDFGTPDLAFVRIPVGAEDIATLVGDQEPRAQLIVDERPDLLDHLKTTVNVGVSIFTKGGGAL